MSVLFKPANIGPMILRNRFVRSATWEGMATSDGAVTPRLLDTIEALSRGGVGLIITGHAFVSPEGQGGPGQIGIYKDEFVPGLSQMAKAAHDYGASIVLQIAHAGYYAAHHLTGIPAVAVSAIDNMDSTPRRELSVHDIQMMIRSFAMAAARAKAAGFDGVQIHSAHGYLLNQFLSPFFNHRTDKYGGCLQNRARVHLEIIQAVRLVVGQNYPIMIKLNGRDFVEGGLELEDSEQAASLMEAAGLNALELSSGTSRLGKVGYARTGITNQQKEAYNQAEAQVFKRRLKIPLILVGGIRSLPTAQRLLSQGICNFISMSRPFICEPDLVNRWQSGDHRKAACISDNLCFVPTRSGKGLCCMADVKKLSRLCSKPL